MNYFYELQFFLIGKSVGQYFLLSCAGDPEADYVSEEVINHSNDGGRFQDLTAHLGGLVSEAEDLAEIDDQLAFCSLLGSDETFREKLPGELMGISWKESDQGPLFNLVQVYFSSSESFTAH